MDHVLRFTRSLEKAVEHAHTLETILSGETLAIRHRDSLTLSRLVEEKRTVSTQLEAETNEQRSCVQEQGLDFTTAGVREFFERHPVPEHQELWKELRTTIRRCKRLNIYNAVLIQRDRKRVVKSLQTLRGGEREAGTYGPQGQETHGFSISRSISEA